MECREDVDVAWMMIDDQLHGHRKFVKLGADRFPATGLWVTAGSWVAGAMTDGFVPDYVVEQWDPALSMAKRLVQVGLWEDATADGEVGYQFHDWTEINRTRDQIIAERAYNARRTALHRDPKLTAAVRMRDEGRCRYCGVQVNWTDRRSVTGATYDHVDPDGPNTLDNVVVACRGCNASKAGRTPEMAGMVLLPPGSTGPRGPRGGGAPTPRGGPNPVSSSDLDQDSNQTYFGVQTLPDLPTPPHPTQVVTTPRSAGSARTARETAGPEFEQWYKIYPRHKEPEDAAKAWIKVRKRIDHATLMAATHRFARARKGQDPKFTPYPASWLNAGGYADEPDRPTAAGYLEY